MHQQNRLNEQLEALKLNWDKLSADLSRIQVSYDNETRVEEHIRLEPIIEDKKNQLVAIEKEIQSLKINNLISKAQTATKNKAYQKGYDLWQELLRLAPEHSQALKESNNLQQILAQQQTANLLIAKLIERIDEIPHVFSQVVTELKQPCAEVSLIAEQTEKFINNTLAAEHYTEICKTLLSQPQSSYNTDATNYSALAERINRGEIVFFIGSNLQQEYGKTSVEEDQLAKELAKKIDFTSFNGSLSSIAELYQISPDCSSEQLLSELNKALPSSASNIKLYHSLAKIKQPLVLISSAYDDLLEQAFEKTGKKYAELSSIIVRTDEYDIGHINVRYSDNKHPERTYIEEELSRLQLLEEGYSLIYKIRGTCKEKLQTIERDTLTLTESNYFKFARYGKKIIPSYLSRQFRDRGFLFVGSSIKNWEDRLLVKTLLDKRKHSTEVCYTLGRTAIPRDKMETVYWDKRNVREHQANLQDLDNYLEEVISASQQHLDEQDNSLEEAV